MDYINQLKLNNKLYLKEVEKLEKENKKIRAQLQKIAGEVGGNKYWKELYYQKNTELEKENAILKSQVEELNTTYNNLKNSKEFDTEYYKKELEEARKETRKLIQKNQLALNILRN